MQRKLKTERKSKIPENNRKEGTSKPSPKKGFFVNKILQTSIATSNTYNSDFNVEIPQ